MPLWRKLHKKIIDSQAVNDMPDDFTRVLWMLLPLICDREGRGLYNPSWVRAHALTLREDVDNAMVMCALKLYAERGMIKPYRVEGRDYFFIPMFHKYQGSTDKEAASIIPEPPKQEQINSGPTPDLLRTYSGTDSDSEVEVDSEVDAKTPGAKNAPAAPGDKTSPEKSEPNPAKNTRIADLPAAAQVFLDKGGKLPTGKLGDGTRKADKAIEIITAQVRSTPEELEFWGKVVEAWCLMWSPKSYTVMLNDYYARRRIPGQSSQSGNGANGFKPAPKRILKDA